MSSEGETFIVFDYKVIVRYMGPRATEGFTDTGSGIYTFIGPVPTDIYSIIKSELTYQYSKPERCVKVFLKNSRIAPMYEDGHDFVYPGIGS